MPNAANLVHSRSLKRFLTKIRLKEQGCNNRMWMGSRISVKPQKRQKNAAPANYAASLLQSRKNAITSPKENRDLLLKSPELSVQDEHMAIDDDVIILDPLDFQIEYEHYPLNAVDLVTAEQDQDIIIDANEVDPENDPVISNEDIPLTQDDGVFLADLLKCQCGNYLLAAVFAITSIDDNYSILSKIVSDL